MFEFNFGIRKPDDFSPISENILIETVVPQFERIVEKYPDRLAVKDSEGSLTYRELNNSINDLAHKVIEVADQDNTPVAFLFNRELVSIIVMMCLNKLGKPSVGLHPSNSIQQLQAFLEDSTAKTLITSSEFIDLIDHLSTSNPSLKIILYDEIATKTNYENPLVKHTPEDIFGIFYTSGSTGKPKGVMIGHLYKSQSILYQTNDWFFSPSDKISLVTSVCYLASHPSVFGALLNGGCLCLFDIKNSSAQRLMDWIVEEGLTVFRCTPSIFRNVFGKASKDVIFSNLRFITLGGEPVTGKDIDLFKQHTNKDCILVNNYSSTEAGTICHFAVNHNLPTFEGLLPAGYPAPGKEVFILNDNGEQVARGETGEIVVRSKYLNLGYWRQEDLTIKKFHTDPVDPDFRFVNSGDLGQFRDDGVLEVKGRKDTQVKIRGFRIQLENIDAALRSIAGVDDAATIVDGDVHSRERLVAFIALKKGETLPVNRIRQFLSQKLPGYMIPSKIIFMSELPRTATGKLSRLDLPTPTTERPELSVSYVAPQPGVESDITNVWIDLLGIDKIGVDDNFFDIGGDSLLALEMSLAVEAATSKGFPQQFFKNPTIKYLSTLLEEQASNFANDDNFKVSSFPSEIQSLTKKVKSKKKKSILKRLISRKYTKRDLDFPFRYLDLRIRRYLARLTYDEAIAWSLKWSNNAFVRKVFYYQQKILFEKWLAELSDDHSQILGSFQQSIFANMFFNLPKAVSKNEKGTMQLLQAYKKSKYNYWHSLGDIIVDSPPSELLRRFPLKGVENLKEAWKQGKGVILLSYHGAPHPGGFLPLAKILGTDSISTISYQIPIRKSKYHDQKDQITETAAFTMNAEIALFGQKILQEGGIVNFASDTNDHTGRTFKVSIGKRFYQVKGGFAEMALNTGAIVIPFNRYCLQDGRLQMEFFPPINPGDGPRQHKVETMIKAYAMFIEQSWRAHPDGMNWTRMRKHMARSVSDELTGK